MYITDHSRSNAGAKVEDIYATTKSFPIFFASFFHEEVLYYKVREGKVFWGRTGVYIPIFSSMKNSFMKKMKELLDFASFGCIFAKMINT